MGSLGVGWGGVGWCGVYQAASTLFNLLVKRQIDAARVPSEPVNHDNNYAASTESVVQPPTLSRFLIIHLALRFRNPRGVYSRQMMLSTASCDFRCSRCVCLSFWPTSLRAQIVSKSLGTLKCNSGYILCQIAGSRDQYAKHYNDRKRPL